MQSMQVKVAPRQRFRWGSSFFLVRTSPQAVFEAETIQVSVGLVSTMAFAQDC